MVVRRNSRVVPSDDEVALAIRAANPGQPEEWIDEAIAAELSVRKARAAAVQAAYDPSPVKEFAPVSKPIGEESSGMSATYTMPKE